MPPDSDDARAHGGLVRGLRWIVKALLLVAAVLSALVAVASAGIFVTDRYNEEFRWRQREYTKLAGLHAGYTRERFRAVLGTPVFSRKAPRTGLREDSFRRRDHWVQAVSKADGTVLLYAVTSCDPEFRPEFSIPVGGRVVLGKSRMATVVSANVDQAVELNYSTGNTINATYIDEIYGANPGNYQTFAWGRNDACQPAATEDAPHLTGRVKGTAAEAGPEVQRFRRQAIVNTYAETAPAEELAKLNRSYQTGVDRILTRTVDNRAD